MDIASAYILHHKILKDLNKDIENKYIPFRDMTDIKDNHPNKGKNCPKCGQDIYFCVCSINNSSTKSYKDYSPKINK